MVGGVNAPNTRFVAQCVQKRLPTQHCDANAKIAADRQRLQAVIVSDCACKGNHNFVVDVVSRQNEFN